MPSKKNCCTLVADGLKFRPQQGIYRSDINTAFDCLLVFTTMKIVLASIGKTTRNYITDETATYATRIRHYLPFEQKEWPDRKNLAGQTAEEVKKREAQIILGQLREQDTVVLLDEKGRQISSEGFARFLQQKMNMGTRQLVFLIGGAYGFSDDIYKRFPESISLSPMTFTHQMVRLFCTEQIYRALTILRGEPYHHS